MTDTPSGPAVASVAVLIVEDHPLMRETLCDAVDRLTGYHVVDAVGSGEAALDVIDANDVGLAVLDLSLPAMSGTELVAEVGRRRPDLTCVVLSGHRERHYVDGALHAGARGYILKGNPAELGPALRRVADGDIYVSPALSS